MSKRFKQEQLTPHYWLVSSIVPDLGPGLWIYSSGEDGRVLHTSVESGMSTEVWHSGSGSGSGCSSPQLFVWTRVKLLGCWADPAACLLTDGPCQVINLNPGLTPANWHGDVTAVSSLYSLAGAFRGVDDAGGTLFAGDGKGVVHVHDVRVADTVQRLQAHKKAKVCACAGVGVLVWVCVSRSIRVVGNVIRCRASTSTRGTRTCC